MGGKSWAELPIREEIWQAKPFLAYFAPRCREFSITVDRGVVEAGAKVMPFKIVFAPKDSRPKETMLIVDLGDMEQVVKVTGTVCGFQRSWGRRPT